MKRPQKINRMPTAEDFNALVDYAHSLELKCGAGFRQSVSSNGTVISSNQPGIITVVTDVYYDIDDHILYQDKQNIVAEPSGAGTNTVISNLYYCGNIPA